MRQLLAICLLALLSTAASADGAAFDVKRLDPELSQASAPEITSGALDARFLPRDAMSTWPRASDYWLRITLPEAFQPRDVPTVNVRKGRNMNVEMFVVDHGQPVALRFAMHVPGFVGAQDAIYILPAGLHAGQPVYVHATANSPGPTGMRFVTSTLPETMTVSADHARMIALSFGALMAMSVAALLIWFVLSDRLLLLYATLFALQALYVAYLSGQGFEWPVLSLALPAIGYTWNIAAAFSGAVACLFVREIAELQRLAFLDELELDAALEVIDRDSGQHLKVETAQDRALLLPAHVLEEPVQRQHRRDDDRTRDPVRLELRIRASSCEQLPAALRGSSAVLKLRPGR